MNIYTIYADIAEGNNPHDFVKNMRKFLDSLPTLESYRITRMKLGFRSMDIGEFRIDMEFKTMQDLDDAMTRVVRNDDDIESKHVAFNSMVDMETIQHFLYRDFPDDIQKPKATVQQKKFTTEEIVEATKGIAPEIW